MGKGNREREERREGGREGGREGWKERGRPSWENRHLFF